MHMHQRALVSSLLVATLASGCATSPAMQAYQAPHRAHPDVEQRARKIRTIAVLPPDIRISSLSAGGVAWLRDDSATPARANGVRAPQTAFKDQPVVVKMAAVRPDVRAPRAERP